MSRRAGLDRETVVRTAAEMSDAGEDWTLAALAARLGVRTPSLYNHIEGQEALHRELALLGLRELAGRITRAAVGKRGPEAMMAVARSYRAYAMERPGVYSYTQRAPDPDDPEMLSAATAIVEVVAEVVSAFDLRDAVAIHAIRGFRSLLHGFVTLEAQGGFGMPVDLDASFEFALRAYIDGLQALTNMPERDAA